MSGRSHRTSRAVTVFTAMLISSIIYVASAGHAAAAVEKAPAATAQELINASDCTSCHTANQKLVGPSYNDIAKRYRGKPNAEAALIAKVKAGGSGNWGDVAMTPHPNLSDSRLKTIVDWILSRGGAKAGVANPAVKPAAPAKMYSYTLKDGTSVKLDFPLFVEGQESKVTKAVFHGYENYDAYCYRCHGQDAEGGELAPDLKHTLSGGMTPQEFLSVAMAGRPDKGMPSWAGFLSEEEVRQIYEYVKGRSVGLIPVGRPSSEMD